MKYCGNNICPDKWTDKRMGQPENIIPSPTLFGGGGIKQTKV